MATVERQIVEAVVAALKAAQIDGVEQRVFEDRGFTVATGELPAIDVMAEDVELDVLDLADQQMAQRLRVDVAVMACESIGASPSKIADPIVAVVHRTLMRDAAIAALVRTIEPGPVRRQRQESGDGGVLRRVQSYTVDFVTAVDDLEATP